jgi:hypothetical protein
VEARARFAPQGQAGKKRIQEFAVRETQVPTDNSEQVWKYLSYVTVNDIVGEGKGFILAWLGISISCLVIGGLFEYGQDQLGFSASKVVFSPLPKWLWWPVWPVMIAGAVLWFGKGKEIRFTVPVFGFKSWLFIMLLFGGMLYTLENFEWWVSLPFFWGCLFAEAALDTLAVIGKENYERLNKERTAEP